MAPSRRRRATLNEEPDGSQEEEPVAQRRRVSQAAARDDDEAAGFSDAAEDATQPGGGDMESMTKNLVRLALASEFSRTPLRRAEIGAKVLGPHGRSFKTVFARAQNQLRTIFGMELTELPLREKVTLAQRKAAAKSQSQQKSSGAWVLRTTLPKTLRDADIIPPANCPTAESEAQYVALYSFVISLIMLSGGSLADGRLDRYLARVNVNDVNALTNSMAINGVDKTDKLMKRMERDGYVYKVRDNSGGDEVVEWLVGPRGKLEVGEHGVRGMVQEVFGEPEDVHEFHKRLDRSLAFNVEAGKTADGADKRQPRQQTARDANGAGDDQDEDSD